MVKKSPLSVFRGNQGYMYAVALLAWGNYSQYQRDFATLNSKYTKEFADEQQAAIEAARQQPNVKQRRDVPKKARDLINKTAAGYRAIWQLLSSLIENSYSEDLQPIMKSAAGHNYYIKSSDNNWPATYDMGNAATTFIAENEEALTAGGMLPAFPSQFAGVKKTFDGLYGTYYTTKQTAKDDTKKKRSSNAVVYKTTLSMMKDGVKIFRDNTDVREKFVYNSLMKLVSGKGFTKTGYYFICKEAATGLPVSIATVVFTAADGSSYEGKMGKTGNLRCEMPAGKYEYVLKSPGYTTLIGSVKAIEGSMRQKSLKLFTDTGTTSLPQQSKVV